MSYDIDRQETHEDPERSPQCHDQGASTRKANSVSSNVTEDDFIAAREVALFCFSAMEELRLASGDASTLIHRPAPFETDVLKVRQADDTFSRITCVVEFLCSVLVYANVAVPSNPMERNRIGWNDNDAKSLGKISKVEDCLLPVSTERAGRAGNTAHEYALRSAIDMWCDIENEISLNQWHEEGSCEPGPGFHLKLREIAENGKEIREQIRQQRSSDYKEVLADVKTESVKALTPGAVVRTQWKTPEIWLRREFRLPEMKTDDLVLLVHHDEDVEIYINGVLAAKAGRYTTAHEELPPRAEARAALRPGKNVLAVHCNQTEGGQYIDVEIAELIIGVIRAEIRTAGPNAT